MVVTEWNSNYVSGNYGPIPVDANGDWEVNISPPVGKYDYTIGVGDYTNQEHLVTADDVKITMVP